MTGFSKAPQPEVKIPENSKELNAFLESLLYKGYVFDVLLDDNYDYYIISRQEDNKMGLIGINGWFNGNDFTPNEYWFNGIDTQEMNGETFIEFGDDRGGLICKLLEGKIVAGEKQEIDINDLVNAALANFGGNLN